MSFCCQSQTSVIFFLIVNFWCNGICFGHIVPVNNENETEVHNSTLELVHLLFRHGPRTPVELYPNDPYLNHTFYPYGWGALTNAGKMELFQLGKALRKRYRTLLEPYYYNDLLHAQSTASSRTLQSMALVLASMFPPKGTPMEWNVKYNWQPIPIYSVPKEQDKLLHMQTNCARYDEALSEVFALPEIKAELALNEPLFRNMSELTGEEVTRPIQLNWFYFSCIAELAYGLELSDEVKEYFPDKVKQMATLNYLYNVYTKEMQRMRSGTFLQKMFNEMQSKATDILLPKTRKIFMYCGHDWTITNILIALNIWPEQIPGFSALIAFELHKRKDNDEYYVEIFYQNNAKGKLKRLTIPGCTAECSLMKLIELSKDVLPIDAYEKMCDSKLKVELENQENQM